MIGAEQDLMLNLMQIADEPEPPPAPAESQGVNPLSLLKPYPHHKGECMGMVSVQPGTDEDENFCMRFFCIKCGKEEIMPVQVVGNEGRAKGPEWVSPPNV